MVCISSDDIPVRHMSYFSTASVSLGEGTNPVPRVVDL